ncbi:MAG TPA: isoprenylcysteine carboxylmethyltransferase family protein [Anaerolineales bacterium]|nr:isoprenylcysteine carboxylmethyltransferase family protein [Anaerolineales bacterium]
MSFLKLKHLDPSLYNLLLPLSVVAHFIFPITGLVHAPLRYFGVGVIFLGLVINFRAMDQLKKMPTPIQFGATPKRLVTGGIYRISRNPIYLGGVIALLGIAIFLGSLITFFFPVILFLILDRIYIPIEESRMEELFGAEYIKYQKNVRRWL